MNLVRLAALAPALVLAAAPARAAELPDPTRPPAAMQRAVPAPASASGPVRPVERLQLQSILTGDGRKPAVIINGRALELGEAFDDMRLTRVSGSGAVLSGPRGLLSLTLTPAADKQLAEAAPANTAATATAMAATSDLRIVKVSP